MIDARTILAGALAASRVALTGPCAPGAAWADEQAADGGRHAMLNARLAVRLQAFQEGQRPGRPLSYWLPEASRLRRAMDAREAVALTACETKPSAVAGTTAPANSRPTAAGLRDPS